MEVFVVLYIVFQPYMRVISKVITASLSLGYLLREVDTRLVARLFLVDCVKHRHNQL